MRKKNFNGIGRIQPPPVSGGGFCAPWGAAQGVSFLLCGCGQRARGECGARGEFFAAQVRAESERDAKSRKQSLGANGRRFRLSVAFWTATRRALVAELLPFFRKREGTRVFVRRGALPRLLFHDIIDLLRFFGRLFGRRVRFGRLLSGGKADFCIVEQKRNGDGKRKQQ